MQRKQRESNDAKPYFGDVRKLTLTQLYVFCLHLGRFFDSTLKCYSTITQD